MMLKLKIFIAYNIRIINLLLLKYYALSFNKLVKSQNLDYKKIPIIIISYNQLHYLKKLIDFLKSKNYENIVIIDNNSNFLPLLDYLKLINDEVTIYKMDKNYGHEVFWKRNDLFLNYNKGYHVITDPDILPICECPDDFVLNFKKKLDSNIKITKVGFSLKIDDIPEENKNKSKIINWENQYWINKNKDGDFIAKIDTTFAIYRPYHKYVRNELFFKAIRTNYPYQAFHGGWYVDTENLSEEQMFYYANCDSSASWRISNEGDLFKDIYK